MLKRGGKVDQGVGALKRGGGGAETLTNHDFNTLG